MTQQPTNFAALLNGESLESYPILNLGKKWRQPGEKAGGRIVSDPSEYHVTKAGKPGPDGKRERIKQYYDEAQTRPIKGIRVNVQTAERDPLIEGDTGIRTLMIDGTLRDRGVDSLRRAVSLAVQAKGAQMFEKGGELYVWWTHEVDTGAPTPAQHNVAEYIPPGVAAATATLGVAPAPQYQAPAAPAPQAPAPALPPGFTEQSWAALPQAARDSILAAQGAATGDKAPF